VAVGLVLRVKARTVVCCCLTVEETTESRAGVRKVRMRLVRRRR
jgi:hypothetical protein